MNYQLNSGNGTAGDYDSSRMQTHPARHQTQEDMGYPNYTIDESLRYGAMPHEMLAVKFEETDLGYDEEETYNDYARSTLMDRGPDPIMTAADEPRRGGWSGRLNAQYYGGRGGGDLPAHPEMFLGEIDGDPRGHVDEPNMDLMRGQWSERTRFQRWTPDHQSWVTGGGRSETQVMADKQSGFRWVRDRLKVFSRQLDGRRSALQGSWRQVSRAGRIDRERSRYSGVADAAQQRRHIIEKYASGTTTRDTREYRESTTDQEMEVAVLGQARKHGRVDNSQQRATAHTTDGNFAIEAASRQFKTAAGLLADIVATRDRMVAEPTTRDGEAAPDEVLSMARRHESIVKDLAALMQQVVGEANMGIGRETMSAKTAALSDARAATSAPLVFNHLMPAHLLHIPELMYKTAALPRDQRKITAAQIRDAHAAEPMTEGSAAKSAKHGSDQSRASRATVNIIRDDTTATYNYKQKRMTAPSTAGISAERFASESDATQRRRSRAAGGNPHGSEARGRVDSSAATFGGNMAPVRHGGRFGNKNMVRRGAKLESATASSVLNDLS